MRILFCNYEYPPLGGGGGVFNKQIAEELAKRHTVDVLTSQGMNLPAFSVENGVNIYIACLSILEKCRQLLIYPRCWPIYPVVIGPVRNY